MQKYHNIDNVYWHDNIICLAVNGKSYELNNILQISSRLAKANEYKLSVFEICPTGYSIHCHLIDEDLSVDRLLYKIPEMGTV